MYFNSIPKIIYDSYGNGDFKVVTNLLRRVAVRAKIRTNTLIYDTYDVKNGETPESIAYKLYGDTTLHWVILLVNDITDRYHQWPMSYIQFSKYVTEKYDNVNGVHHYEVAQSSGEGCDGDHQFRVWKRKVKTIAKIEKRQKFKRQLKFCRI